MKRKLLIAAGLLAATSAFANDVDLLPNGYLSAAIRAAQSAPSAKSRAQVVAETREAARLGLLNVGEAGITLDVTPEQLHQIEQAGLRALAIQSAAK
jgi:hypothetical protein